MTGLTNRTVLCHHFSGSWHTPDSPYYETVEAARVGELPLLSDILQKRELTAADKVFEFFQLANWMWSNKEKLWGRMRELLK